MVEPSETVTDSSYAIPETEPTNQYSYTDSEGTLINRKAGVHKENDVSIYPVVEWAPFSENAEIGQYTDVRLIDLDLYLHGFKEIHFEMTEEANSADSGKFKDIKYTFDGSRLQINFTYETNKGSSEWELHAEHTEKELDISDIGGADPSTFFGPKKLDGMIISSYMSYYQIPYGFNSIEVYLDYNPRTGNMYSLHSDMPEGPGFNLIHSDKDYLPLAFLYGTSEEVVSEFTIKFGQETRTYSYTVGMKFEDWVKSKFNTDGWRLFSGLVISPDDEYYVFNDDIVKPDVKAAKR